MKRAGTLLIAAVLLLTFCACKRETRPAVGLGTFHGEQVSVYGGDWQASRSARSTAARPISR